MNRIFTCNDIFNELSVIGVRDFGYIGEAKARAGLIRGE